MSYESSIIELEPILYCPIFVFNESGPVDLVSNVNSSISGSFSLNKNISFPKRSVVLDPFSSILVDVSETNEFLSEELSYCLWFSKKGVSGPVLSVGDNNTGLALSVDENFNLVVFYDGLFSDTITQQVTDEYHLVILSISGDIYDGEDGEGDIQDPILRLYFDGILVYEKNIFSLPGSKNILFNSLYGSPGQTQTEISQYFVFPYEITESEAKNVYDLGVSGRQIFELNSDTAVGFSDEDQTYIQTSWQAYGIVTGKT